MLKGVKKTVYTDEDILFEASWILTSGFTYEEVSKVTGIPHSTVGWHMKNALFHIDPNTYYDVREVVKAHKLHKKHIK